MKEIDVEKVRSAILSLQANGKHEFASIVWDLLDNYVSQKLRPTVRRQDGVQTAHDHVKAAKEIVRSLRGASSSSAFANAPLCQISRYNPSEAHCENTAIGSLNAHDNSSSWLACGKHGELYGSSCEDRVDWVQTFFGDENSAAGERSE